MTEIAEIVIIFLAAAGGITWCLYKKSKRRKRFGDDYLIDSFL